MFPRTPKLSGDATKMGVDRSYYYDHRCSSIDFPQKTDACFQERNPHGVTFVLHLLTLLRPTDTRVSTFSELTADKLRYVPLHLQNTTFPVQSRASTRLLPSKEQSQSNQCLAVWT